MGTRLDLEEALTFAADGNVKAILEMQPLESINVVFQRLKGGIVTGRVVLGIGEQASQQEFQKPVTSLKTTWQTGGINSQSLTWFLC